MIKNDVQRRLEAVAILRMQQNQPFVWRTIDVAWMDSKAQGCFFADKNFVPVDVPVPDGVTRAGQCQSLTFHVADKALNEGAAGKSVLHYREGYQQHYEHKSSAQRRLNDIVVQLPADGHVGTANPGDDEQPGGNQQNGAIKPNVSVNVSAVQIRYTDIVSIVRNILYETGLPASRLELEVTESVLIDDFDYALHVLRGIKNLGVSLAMDDFGTGYSSLSSLTAFPFDKLKIDRSFIMELENSHRMAPVTKAIIALGKNLDLKIIAEGVESPAHVDFLRENACDEMQGYLLGKALPQEQVLQLLKNPTLDMSSPRESSPVVPHIGVAS